jgi:hypothetical protein
MAELFDEPRLHLDTKLGVPVPDGPRRAFSADEKSSDSDGCFVPLHLISGDFELGCRSIRERPLHLISGDFELGCRSIRERPLPSLN